jgi:hypothetical protein
MEDCHGQIPESGMKKLALLVALFILPSLTFAQYTSMYTSYGLATTVKTTIAKSSSAPYVKLRGFEVYNDSTGTGDTLFVAFNADTTFGRYFPIVEGEKLTVESVYLSFIRIWTSGRSIPYRARLH